MSIPVQRAFRLGGGLFAAFFLLTAVVVAGWTQSVDDAWLSLMEESETLRLVSIAELFHDLGSLPIAAATTMVVAVGFAAMRKWWAVVAWVGMVVGANVLSTLTKLLVDRSRPVDSLVLEPSASYPSGHAMVSGAAIGIGLAVIAGILWPKRHRLFLSVGIVYALVMAWSRTYLRVHWLTDVVGGLLFGTAIVCLVAAVVIQHRGDSPNDLAEPDG
ncbi:MAG: phosphatase PAP2 family protein [Acidimicrobiia bacterium]|nr:phosphatase PAP2 family protein [Acidimicrobiia bacterium]